MTPRSSGASASLDLATHRDEQLIVERVRQGDALALEMIFMAFHAELVALAQRATGMPALAEDVVQDVFLAIWSGRERWQIRATLRGYLRTAVHNAAVRSAGTRSRAAARGLSLEAAERAAPERLADRSPAADRSTERRALADAVSEAARAAAPRS
ncbi:MAG TPA: sigma factor [Gemmatimonadaceae bacterium]